MADVRRLKAEVSVYKKKIRSGGRVLKYLRVAHNIRVNVDPVTWEPMGGPLAIVPAAGISSEPAQTLDPPVSQEDPPTLAPPSPPAPPLPVADPTAMDTSPPPPVREVGESSGLTRPLPPSAQKTALLAPPAPLRPKRTREQPDY